VTIFIPAPFQRTSTIRSLVRRGFYRVMGSQPPVQGWLKHVRVRAEGDRAAVPSCRSDGRGMEREPKKGWNWCAASGPNACRSPKVDRPQRVDASRRQAFEREPAGKHEVHDAAYLPYTGATMRPGSLPGRSGKEYSNSPRLYVGCIARRPVTRSRRDPVIVRPGSCSAGEPTLTQPKIRLCHQPAPEVACRQASPQLCLMQAETPFPHASGVRCSPLSGSPALLVNRHVQRARWRSPAKRVPSLHSAWHSAASRLQSWRLPVSCSAALTKSAGEPQLSTLPPRCPYLREGLLTQQGAGGGHREAGHGAAHCRAGVGQAAGVIGRHAKEGSCPTRTASTVPG
jgi:hypothetical protein